MDMLLVPNGFGQISYIDQLCYTAHEQAGIFLYKDFWPQPPQKCVKLLFCISCQIIPFKGGLALFCHTLPHSDT